MRPLALLLVTIAGVFAQCGTYTANFYPTSISIPQTSDKITVNFLEDTVGYTAGSVVVKGGEGLSVVRINATGVPTLLVTSFGDISATDASTNAAARTSATFFSFFSVIMATLGIVGMKRIEPFFLLILVLGLFAHEVTSACTASVTVYAASYIRFEGDIQSRLTANCPNSESMIFMDDGYTIAYCPWVGRYTRVWAASSNEAACASAVPMNATVVDGRTSGQLIFNKQATTVLPLNHSMYVTLGRGIPLQRPSAYPNVTIAGFATIDVLLQKVDISSGGHSGVVPVTVRAGTNLCKFGFKCIAGDCLRQFDTSDNKCVDFGFQDPNPISCSNRSVGGTGMNCGQPCTTLTCLSYCPGFDCSAARPCEAGDSGAYPCGYCQCQEDCSILNDGWTITPAPLLLLCSLGLAFVF